jgi:acyl carrier protein
MADAELIETIGGFMSRAFEGREIGTDEDIFEAGFGNSMFAMQLVNFVERKFGIEIDSEDLQIDNFRTIGRVAALVERKRMVSGSV